MPARRSRYRLAVEYRGTRYHGWQDQLNARTVSGELRLAIQAAGHPVLEIMGSGRTDTGVHALEQTAHLVLERPADLRSFRDSVNELLPADIQVLGLWPVDEAFHARRSARARSYLYQVSTRRTAMAKHFVWWVKRPLDLKAMREAWAALAGSHDFRAFCAEPQRQASTRVVVDETALEQAGALIVMRIVASHFLWKMVRRLVGSVVRVGAGELAPDGLARLLAGEAPAREVEEVAKHTAPPSGLFLERVLYPGEAPLAPLAPAVAVAPEPVLASPARASRGGRREPFRPPRR